MTSSQKYSGFTLIEILVVVGLIAILAAVTIVAINPAKNFEQTRDAQRSSDVGVILNAITQYTSEDGNTLAGFIAATDFTGTVATCGVGTTPIANELVVGGANTDEATYINLDVADFGGAATPILVDEYVVAIPVDPNGSSVTTDGSIVTGYTMCQTAGGRVTISATPERASSISVSR